jgi:hypothetical protein
MLLEPLDKFLSPFAKSFRQGAMDVSGRENLRPFRMQPAVPDPDLMRAVHQFGHEEETKARAAESIDPPFRGTDDLRIFDRVLKTVLAQHEAGARYGVATCAQRFF